MDKSGSNTLIIVLAIAFWAFMLLTPLGGAVLDVLLRVNSVGV